MSPFAFCRRHPVVKLVAPAVAGMTAMPSQAPFLPATAGMTLVAMMTIESAP